MEMSRIMLNSSTVSSDAPRARAEVGDDRLALLLRHLAVHQRDRKVCLAHLVSEPLTFAPRVAEDDCLQGT